MYFTSSVIIMILGQCRLDSLSYEKVKQGGGLTLLISNPAIFARETAVQIIGILAMCTLGQTDFFGAWSLRGWMNSHNEHKNSNMFEFTFKSASASHNQSFNVTFVFTWEGHWLGPWRGLGSSSGMSRLKYNPSFVSGIAASSSKCSSCRISKWVDSIVTILQIAIRNSLAELQHMEGTHKGMPSGLPRKVEPSIL